MIPLLIFSKDRAMQLDALLRSLDVNGRDNWNRAIFNPVTVLYTTTLDESATAYRELISPNGHRAWPITAFVREGIREEDFATTVRNWLKRRVVCAFMCDDDILYSQVGMAPVVALENEEVLAFSLRLGNNCVHCYPLDQPQIPPVFTANDVYVTWPWREGAHDFGYPASLDGHVFRVSDILPILERSDFTNPNTMEDALVQGLRNSDRSCMASYYESVLVGIPDNVVNTTHANRHQHGSAAALNRAFLRGRRISLEDMDFTGVNAAHCPIELVIK